MNTDDQGKKADQLSDRLTLIEREFEFTLASIKRLERKTLDRSRRRNSGSDSTRP